MPGPEVASSEEPPEKRVRTSPSSSERSCELEQLRARAAPRPAGPSSWLEAGLPAPAAAWPVFASSLQVSQHGPLDFGGQLVEYLWGGVRVEYSAPLEFLLLLSGLATDKDRRRGDAGKRIVAPELNALLRCSRTIRVGLLVEIETRRRIVEARASNSERQRFEEICDEVKDRYPKSWALACRQDWFRTDPWDAPGDAISDPISA